MQATALLIPILLQETFLRHLLLGSQYSAATAFMTTALRLAGLLPPAMA